MKTILFPRILAVAIISCMLSGCVGNKFYRHNATVTRDGGRRIRIKADQQDRFVPVGLEQQFMKYVSGSRSAPAPGWRPDKRLCIANNDIEEMRNTNYFLSFLELDEYAQLWYHSSSAVLPGPKPMREDWPDGKLSLQNSRGGVDQRDQLKHAVNLIRFAKAASGVNTNNTQGQIRVFIYIHGWKHNASDSAPNVWGFRHLLHAIACQDPAIPVVGIYVGWRGAQTPLPVAREFTFFNRYITARAMPGTDLLEALTTLRAEAKGIFFTNANFSPSPTGDGSPVLMIGHSMGSLVLERAISVATSQEILGQRLWNHQSSPAAVNSAEHPSRLTKLAEGNPDSQATASTQNAKRNTNRPPFMPPFDGVIFLNSAAEAADAHQLLSALKENEEWLQDTEPSDMPFFLALTSRGDAVTRIMLPVGTTLSGGSNRDYREKENRNGNAGRLKSQAVWSKHSVATIRELATHRLCRTDADGNLSRDSYEKGCPPREIRKDECPQIDGKTLLCWRGMGGRDKGNEYWLEPLKPGWNTTRYWAAEMPEILVPDHGTFFHESFASFLIAVSEKWRTSSSSKRCPCAERMVTTSRKAITEPNSK